MRDRQIRLLLDEQHAIDEKIEKLTKKRDRVAAKLDALRARCNHSWLPFASDKTREGCERCGAERDKASKAVTMKEVADQINQAREEVKTEGVESIRDASKRLMDSTEPVVEAKPQN